ncbi:CPBP family intramembrane glutamic endopeptidase [Synechocystis sp. PCC 7509]|uniref:CPBP family intramembrane glutamic endopeptidase n=1 Tax=Synechocystis sp. PCC 7509 TaxID=927677 RepID=UPI00192CC796|nr:type II CAAX endopeptidase family protein [Synechocystis sp. PCC 7509]
MNAIPSSLLQVTIFFVAWVCLWLPLGVVSTIILQKNKAISVIWQPFKPITADQKIPLLASLYLIAPLILWGANKALGNSFANYGVIWDWSILRSNGIGFIIGTVGLALLFGVQTLLGWIKWQIAGKKIISVTLPILLLAVWISAIEELIFRGFVLTQLQQDYSIYLAAVIASVIFALLHLVWEQKETLPQLPGLWLMGMVLVLARYIDKGSLGLAWGLHSGLVWAIATIDTAELITYTGKVPQWVTGKYGKPLAGLMGMSFLLAIGAVLWLGLQ